MKLYLAGKTKAGRAGARRSTKATPPESKRNSFSETISFFFEQGDIKILRDGRCQMTIYVPFDNVPEALKLRTAYGILLEAKVEKVKRKLG